MWERLAFSFWCGSICFTEFIWSINSAVSRTMNGPHQKEIAANKDYKSLKNIYWALHGIEIVNQRCGKNVNKNKKNSRANYQCILCVSFFFKFILFICSWPFQCWRCQETDKRVLIYSICNALAAIQLTNDLNRVRNNKYVLFARSFVIASAKISLHLEIVCAQKLNQQKMLNR